MNDTQHTRTVKFSGRAKAADIARNGIVAAVSPHLIPLCPHCGRRAKTRRAHTPWCRARLTL